MSAAHDAAPATVAPFHSPPRSCETLGICQSASRECTGACQQIPGLPIWFAGDEPDDSGEPLGKLETVLIVGCMLLLSLLSVALLAAGGSYLWQWWLA